MLLQVGVYDFGSKLNVGLFLATLFVAIHFPIIYFFLLAVEQRERILDQRRERRERLEAEGRPEMVKERKEYPIFRDNKNIKLVLMEDKPKPERPIQFEDMVTADVVYEWLICLANFLYPFLVLLEEPLYFMVSISLFSVLNIAVAKRQMRTSRNNFFLSLYPFLFHLCFWVFCLCKNNTVLVYTEIACMTILVLGCLHNSITMVVTILYYTVRYIQYLCRKKSE